MKTIIDRGLDPQGTRIVSNNDGVIIELDDASNLAVTSKILAAAGVQYAVHDSRSIRIGALAEPSMVMQLRGDKTFVELTLTGSWATLIYCLNCTLGIESSDSEVTNEIGCLCGYYKGKDPIAEGAPAVVG